MNTVSTKELDRAAALIATKLGCTVVRRESHAIARVSRSVTWTFSDRPGRVDATLILKAEGGYNPQGTWWKGAVHLWSYVPGAQFREIELGDELVPSWGQTSGQRCWASTRRKFVSWAERYAAQVK